MAVWYVQASEDHPGSFFATRRWLWDGELRSPDRRIHGDRDYLLSQVEKHGARICLNPGAEVEIWI